MRALHVVSFDIPWPANYGGVIDVFYKLKALHRQGISVHLHCFQYNRSVAEELLRFCTSVNYYPRNTGLKANIGIRPYIVRSRISEELSRRLLNDDHPILLEGMHTCGILGAPGFEKRLVIYRESNIEHRYYFHLFKAERSLPKKIYLLMESLRLRLFQRRLSLASVMLAVSETDTRYLARRFPQKKIIHLPSFHGHDHPDILPGKGDFCLVHGNLSVPENYRAAEFILKEIWEDGFKNLIIAGMNPPPWLEDMTAGRPNIRLIRNPGEMEMFQLIRHAHLHLMITFQATGLKLKLINALFNGRFCLVNPEMTEGTGLAPLCHIATTPAEFREKVPELFAKTFGENEIFHRTASLTGQYSDLENCKKLLEIVHLQKET
jgi:hypothetical protein